MSEYKRYYVCSCGWFEAPSFGNPWFLPDICPKCGNTAPRYSLESALVVAREVRVRDGWFRSHIELKERDTE